MRCPFVMHSILVNHTLMGNMTFARNVAKYKYACYIKSLEKIKKKKNANIKVVKNMRLWPAVRAGFTVV